MFGCISGSSVADTASIGSAMIPQAVKAGYPRLFAADVTVSGAHLLIGGIIPGLLLGLSLMAPCLIIAHRRQFPKGEPVTLRQDGRARGAAGMTMTMIMIGLPVAFG
jgi:TRAP-type C4-dicarboxylate transport system permease large subunit